MDLVMGITGFLTPPFPITFSGSLDRAVLVILDNSVYVLREECMGVGPGRCSLFYGSRSNDLASACNCKSVRHPREVVAHEYLGLREHGGYEVLVFWCGTHELSSVILKQIVADRILTGFITPVEREKKTMFREDRRRALHNAMRACVVHVVQHTVHENEVRLAIIVRRRAIKRADDEAAAFAEPAVC